MTNTSSVKNSEQSRIFVTKQLENMRERLLDLSNRNPFLSFKFDKSRDTKLIWLVDLDIDSFFERLYFNEEKFFFSSVPEPHHQKTKDVSNSETVHEEKPLAKDYAKSLGINIDYELGNVSRKSKKLFSKSFLQTLHYNEALERKLKKLLNESNSYEEESGVNPLHVVFGFLEWYENENSENPRYAPLFSVPVRMERIEYEEEGIKFYKYALEISESDHQDNLVLKARIENDFGLILPEIEDEDTPGTYFAKIEKLLSKSEYCKRWHVRKQIAFCFLNFAQYQLYRDLDPSIWKNNKLLDNEILLELFGLKETEENYTDEIYDIDDNAFPFNNLNLILDADSSQISAISDALMGKNLVIEGPPGTGKSQTIVNLIALFLLQRKKVLFISEKLAALEVVKNRLEDCGIGDFCLELHSHKTQKNRVLEDLRKRLETNYEPPYQFENVSKNLFAVREKLNRYASILKSKVYFLSDQFTKHEIIWRREKAKGVIKSELEFLEKFVIKDIFNFTSNDFEAGKRITQEIGRRFKNFQHSSISWRDLAWIFIKKNLSESNMVANHIKVLTGRTESLLNLIESFESSNNLDMPRLLNDLSSLNALILSIENPKDSIRKIIKEFADDEAFDICQSVVNYSDQLKQLEKKYPWLDVKSFLSMERLNEIKLIESKVSKFTNFNFSELNVIVFHAKSLCSSAQQLNIFCDKLGFNLNPHKFYEINLLFKSCPITDLGKINLTSLSNPTIHAFKEIKLLLDDIILRTKGLYSSIQKSSNFYDQLTSNICSNKLQEVNLLSRSCSIFEFTNINLTSLFDSSAQTFEEIGLSADNLKRKELELAETFDLSALSEEEIQFCLKSISQAGFFSFLDTSYRKANKLFYSSLVSYNKLFKDHEKLKLLRKKLECILDKNNFLENTLSKLTGITAVFEQLKSSFESVEAIITWKHNIEDLAHKLQEYNILNILKSNYGEIIELLNAFDNLNPYVDTLLESNKFFQERKLIEPNLDNLSNVYKDSSNLIDDIEEAKSLLEENIKGDFLLNDIKSFILDLSNFIDNNKILESKLSLVHKIAPSWPSINDQKIEAIRNSINHFHALQTLPKNLKDWLCADISLRSTNLREFCNNSQEMIKNLSKILNDFHYLADSNHPSIVFGESYGETNLDTLQNKIQDLNSNQNLFEDWTRLCNLFQQLSKLIDEELVTKLIRDHQYTNCFEDIFEFIVYNSATKEILDNLPELFELTGEDLKAFIEDFCTKDDQLIKDMNRKHLSFNLSRVFTPKGGGNTPKEKTDLCLIKHEIGKSRRHIPIRKLIQNAANALLTLKPCFMLGPLSVAQYLPAGLLQFDAVIIDEASQMKIENAIGAIARAKQLIVVGDTKQLPPTNFFKSTSAYDGENNDEDEVYEDTESILNACSLKFAPTRQLKWHYRSRHENLICFSNNRFYDNNLIVFPSPSKQDKNLGISYRCCENGFFEGQKNQPEAEIVAAITLEYMKLFPKESLGVVTMNTTQRDLIDGLLDKLEDDDKNLFLGKGKGNLEPFFIKNLENVQGDERDTIIISTTYGKNLTTGIVRNAFGPINKENGWRRLNVLLTRAKKRIVVITSLHSSDIKIEQTSKRGLKEFRNFLVFCETGDIKHVEGKGELTRGGTESPFEYAVKQILEQHGFEVETQIGIAGYFIDLAIRDPRNTNIFLVGIECDGATYHSSKSARDRDKIRQRVLESLGWRFYRIWSTDWFRNPERETDKLIAHINGLLQLAI